MFKIPGVGGVAGLILGGGDFIDCNYVGINLGPKCRSGGLEIFDFCFRSNLSSTDCSPLVRTWRVSGTE